MAINRTVTLPARDTGTGYTTEDKTGGPITSTVDVRRCELFRMSRQGFRSNATLMPPSPMSPDVLVCLSRRVLVWLSLVLRRFGVRPVFQKT